MYPYWIEFCKGTEYLEHCLVSYCPQLTDEAVRTMAFHCHRLTSLSIGGCPKVWTRNRVTVLGLLLQITYYFIQKFDLLASFSCFSVSFKIWDLALGSIWHSSNGCSYSLKVSTLYHVKVFLSRSWCLYKGEDRRAFTLYITSCKYSPRYWCFGCFGRIVTLF